MNWRTGIGGQELADRNWRTGIGGQELADRNWRPFWFGLVWFGLVWFATLPVSNYLYSIISLFRDFTHFYSEFFSLPPHIYHISRSEACTFLIVSARDHF